MIKILYSDADIAVCVKPAGIASQNDGADDTVKLLSRQTESDVYPVHRLDTATGGVMVFDISHLDKHGLWKDLEAAMRRSGQIK